MRRSALAAGFALAGFAASPTRSEAHRLDEYLQATRIAIARERIDLEIDLTPGAAIASSVVSAIDRDLDGQASDEEIERYAKDVLRELRLVNDEKTASLALTERRVDPLAQLRAGTGAIRLRATAILSPTPAGRHVLTFANAHHPDGSVYLVNALQPDDPSISIHSQRRDPPQRKIAIDYDVAHGAWTRTLALMGGFVVVAVIALARRRRS
jgi:hypothetical protein